MNERYFAKSGISVTESLTKRHIKLLSEACSLLGQSNVWTYNGTIFTNLNSKQEAVKSQQELYQLVANN